MSSVYGREKLSEHAIRLQLIEWREDYAVLKTQPIKQGCATCASGKGCGERTWHRLFLKEDRLYLPRKMFQAPLQAGAYYWLDMSRHTLVIASVLVYGLPLLGFFIGLFLLRTQAEWLQALSAFTLMIAFLLLSRFYITPLLLSRLRIYKDEIK